MPPRVLSFGYSVGPVGIGHHGEVFVVFDQLIDQPLEALVMDIVVCGPMDDQEVSFKPVCMSDRRTIRVALFIVIRKAHVPLLVDCIVQTLVAHKGDSHGRVVELGVTENHV